MSYIKEELCHFKNGIKCQKHHFLCLVYDAILFLILISATFIFSKAVLNLAFSDSPFLALNTMIQNESTRAYTSFIVGIILFFLIMMAVYSFFKFLIWNNLLNQKFHGKSFVKYYLTNLVLFFVLISLQILAVWKIKWHGLLIAVILGIIFHHFNRFFKLHFVKHKHIRKALLLAFKKGLSIHEFLFIYVIVGILVYIYLFVYAYLNSVILFIITPIIILLMMFWLRHYFKARHEF